MLDFLFGGLSALLSGRRPARQEVRGIGVFAGEERLGGGEPDGFGGREVRDLRVEVAEEGGGLGIDGVAVCVGEVRGEAGGGLVGRFGAGRWGGGEVGGADLAEEG